MQQVLDGRYQLDRKIGEGGMARVYAGRDLRLNRRVAIKIPHAHFTGDQDFLERFRHEAQAAAILSDPNIVDVYDVGQDGDIHYIVMEYVEGTDLKTLIVAEAPLAVERAVAIAAQVAHGLAAAHRAGMVHRDIKPQNVIVTPDGRARITDFGVAKSHLSTAMTETGISFGTVDYLSPEQAQGRPATAQSDVYALGITLFEMLTGRLPFAGDNAVAVAMKHVTEPPPAPRALNPAIPPGLEALILRALAKDPAARPQGAGEFARLLAAFATSADQATMVNQALPDPRQQPQGRPQQPQTRPQPRTQPQPTTGNTGRVNIPPPRPAASRAPRQDGLGCGVFFVGMLVLAGVLGLVLLLSTGALDGLFSAIAAGGGNPARPTATAPAATAPAATTTPEPLISVPSLVGLSDSAADQELRRLELVPVRREANDPNVGVTFVISQEVAPGTQLLPGRPVTYTVSLGPPTPELVAVADVTNAEAGVARQILQASGLVVQVTEEPSTVSAGFVIRQSPVGGLRVARGSTVTLVVSQGDVVRFPDLIGQQRDQAEQILRATPGLELIFVDEQGRDRLPNFDSYREGEVVSAQVEGGSGIRNGDLIPRGSRIILGVRGP